LSEENISKAISQAEAPKERDVVVDVETFFVNAKAPGEGEAFANNLKNQIEKAP
jgi:hypothetical protein